MKLSKTGKPICTRCRKLATHTGNLHRSNGQPKHLYYCTEHASSVQDSNPIESEGGSNQSNKG